jgi:ferritin-like metal-binding protein YciE
MNRDLYISWLQDAHAMEEDIARTLEKNIAQAKGYSEVQDKIREHLELTLKHAQQIKECIHRQNEDVSKAKTAFANMMGMAKGGAAGLANDRVLKNALLQYGTENFEIACYTSLREAADYMTDPETMEVCNRIIREEQQMAMWLSDNIPLLTTEVIGGQTAS